MATAYYAQPIPSNYYGPAASHGHHHHHHSAHKQRGYRLCDACGAPETPAVSKFRLCGGCMTTQYCSQDCQRSHWQSHKAICQHTKAQISDAQQQPAYPDEHMMKYLRKFCSSHTDLLGWAGFQALQLKRVPASVRSKALVIDLHFHPHAESHRRFSVAATHVVSRSYISDPLVNQDINRRDERCRKNGGIGALVVIVQSGGISQVIPVEVDPPSKISWDTRPDWPHVLADFVASGRTDFKPISTTSRGVYYG